MSVNTRAVILAVSVSSALLGCVGWRVYASRNLPVPQYEILEDRSGSHPDGCSSLVGLAEQIVQKEPATSKSQVTILIVGDRTTANEPLPLAKYPIPRTRKAIEGRAAGLHRQQDLLADLLQRCHGVRSTTVSPIFFGIVEALADLRAQGCRQTSGCRLYVDSDGEENVNLGIRQALSGTQKAHQALPDSADNGGIEVDFCGLAVSGTGITDSSHVTSTVVHDTVREDRLQRTWRLLFTEPALVSFEPFCPKVSSLASE